MKILGLCVSHDSGVALLDNQKIIFAANQERYSRKKLDLGFPDLALQKMFSYTNCQPTEIDLVVVGGKTAVQELESVSLDPKNTPFARKIFNLLAKLRLTENSFFLLIYQLLSNFLSFKEHREIKNKIKALGIKSRVIFLDHHLCHAASAYYTSGFQQATIVTIDGGGDGLSGTVYRGLGNKLKRIVAIPKIHSLGNLYDYITVICGFKPLRHAGKITGLAAYTNSLKAYQILKEYYDYNAKKISPLNKKRIFWDAAVRELKEKLKDCSREEIAHGGQKILEEIMVSLVKDAIKKTGFPQLAAAGGVFGNVKMNQRLNELSEVKEVFIHPHMGDGGLALGAALWAAGHFDNLQPFNISQAFLGDHYSEEEIKKTIQEMGLTFEELSDASDFIAQKLMEKKVVGIFFGRMEYGPRALCHRTILAEPTDVQMMDWLNKRLERTEFMPFAPVILEEEAQKYFPLYPKSMTAAKFMTLCYDVSDFGKKMAPGIVHIDGTARPQVVNRNDNPEIYAILQKYLAKSGLATCINTSFNRHEEPIVHSPQDALKEFLRGGVEVLVMENLLIKK
jgi:carbamoyltransferase